MSYFSYFFLHGRATTSIVPISMHWGHPRTTLAGCEATN